MSVTLSSTTLAFGDVDPGVSTVKEFTVTIDPPVAQAGSVSVSGANFSVSPTVIAASVIPAVDPMNPVTPEPNVVTVSVTYAAPASPGTHGGTVTVTVGNSSQNVAVSATVVDLTGQGVAEKHLLFEVPDFGDTTFQTSSTAAAIDGTSLNSFLRLGRFDYAQEPARAQELLALIPQVTSATDPGGAAAGTVIVPEIAAGTVFADDIRTRPQDTKTLSHGDDPDHGLTRGGRNAESGRLYSRGGWRDHSDGNRISTTYGDKVEVVRGNYKMIVMGRQTDPAQAMGWDAAGAHIQDYAPGTMPGASFWLEWIDDPRYHAPNFTTDPASAPTQLTPFASGTTPSQKGVWLLVNTTENVYEYARNAGNFREEVWGDVNEAYVGSENPPATGAWGLGHSDGTEGHEPPTRLPGRNYDFPHTKDARATPPWNQDNAGMVRSNPHIIEKTWAARIDSWTGSSACPVPIISEKTFADSITSDTGSSSQRVGTISETTWAENTTAYTNLSGGATESTQAIFLATNTNVGGTIADFTAATTIFEGTVAGSHIEVEADGLHVAIDGSLLQLEVSITAAALAIALGFTRELNIGSHEELRVKEDKTDMQNIHTCLKRMSNAIANENYSWKDTQVAMDMQLNALSVKLGI